jgi:hypothetical protein
MHPLAKLLYQELIAAPVGEIVAYDALSTAIGRDVRVDARHHLGTARRVALRRDRIAFDVEIDRGLRRIVGGAIVGVAENRVERLGRAALRGAEILRAADPALLSPEETARARATQIQLGLARLFASPAAGRQLVAAAESGAPTPSLKSVATRSLKMFSG